MSQTQSLRPDASTVGQPRAAPWGTHDGLAVYRIGEGEPIFLMPGPHRFERPGLRSADALIDALGGIRRQVITYDPPGSGFSTRPAHPGLREMLDCADEALRTGGVEGPADIVGHSMAGLVALAYVLERPSRVRRLVLVGTGTGGPAYMNAPGALWNRTHPRFWRMAGLSIVHMVWPARGPERLLNNLIHVESFWDRTLADVRPVTVADWFRGREGWTGWHWQARRLDYSGRLGEIEVPCLVLCGRLDPQYPLACSEELATGISAADLVVFEHSGHYPYIEERARFQATLASFLADRRAGRTIARTVGG